MQPSPYPALTPPPVSLGVPPAAAPHAARARARPGADTPETFPRSETPPRQHFRQGLLFARRRQSLPEAPRGSGPEAPSSGYGLISSLRSQCRVVVGPEIPRGEQIAGLWEIVAPLSASRRRLRSCRRSWPRKTQRCRQRQPGAISGPLGPPRVRAISGHLWQASRVSSGAPFVLQASCYKPQPPLGPISANLGHSSRVKRGRLAGIGGTAQVAAGVAERRAGGSRAGGGRSDGGAASAAAAAAAAADRGTQGG